MQIDVNINNKIMAFQNLYLTYDMSTKYIWAKQIVSSAQIPTAAQLTTIMPTFVMIVVDLVNNWSSVAMMILWLFQIKFLHLMTPLHLSVMHMQTL